MEVVNSIWARRRRHIDRRRANRDRMLLSRAVVTMVVQGHCPCFAKVPSGFFNLGGEYDAREYGENCTGFGGVLKEMLEGIVCDKTRRGLELDATDPAS